MQPIPLSTRDATVQPGAASVTPPSELWQLAVLGDFHARVMHSMPMPFDALSSGLPLSFPYPPGCLYWPCTAPEVVQPASTNPASMPAQPWQSHLSVSARMSSAGDADSAVAAAIESAVASFLAGDGESLEESLSDSCGSESGGIGDCKNRPEDGNGSEAGSPLGDSGGTGASGGRGTADEGQAGGTGDAAPLLSPHVAASENWYRKQHDQIWGCLSSLYRDRMRPTLSVLCRRLHECGCHDATIASLPCICACQPDRYVLDGGCILLRSPPQWFEGWVDMDSKENVYSRDAWEELNGLLEEDSVSLALAESPLSAALVLRQRCMPNLQKLCLGELCHMVHLKLRGRSFTSPTRREANRMRPQAAADTTQRMGPLPIGAAPLPIGAAPRSSNRA